MSNWVRVLGALVQYEFYFIVTNRHTVCRCVGQNIYTYQKLTKENNAELNLTFLKPTGLEDDSILQSPTRGEEKANINFKKESKN